MIFYLFDFEDFAGGTAFGVKAFITLGLLAIPLCFIKFTDQNLVYGAIFFALAIACLIINIITMIYGLTKTCKAIKENNNYKSRVIKNYCIVLALFIILSIIGFVTPLAIWRITLKGFLGMAILPIIASIVYVLLLDDQVLNKSMKLKDFFVFIFAFFVKFVLGTIIFLTAIIFFIVSIFKQFGIEDRDFEGSKFENCAVALFDYISTNAFYYNNEFEKAREDKEIKEIVQDKINYISNELSQNEDEIKRLDDLTMSAKLDTKLDFLSTYINSKSSMKSFKEDYGLTLEFRTVFRGYREYEHLYLLVVYDLAYEKTYFYEFDTNTLSITREFKKEEVNPYVNGLINKVSNKN